MVSFDERVSFYHSSWKHWWDHGEEAFSVLDEVGPWKVESLEVRVNWPEEKPPVGEVFDQKYFRVKARRGRAVEDVA